MSPVWCVIVAGGSGRRFGGLKQLVSLGGRTVLARAVEAARQTCDGVVVVVPAELVDHEDVVAVGADVVVPGGDTRAESARSGLAEVPASAEVILVHDAARPLASAELFGRVVESVRSGAEAVVPVLEVVDTIRTTEGETIDRSRLRAMQTPQGFPAGLLRRAHDAAAGEDREWTDDAEMAAAVGASILLLQGEPTNLKITDPRDLLVAEALLPSLEGRGPKGRPDGTVEAP